MNEMSKDIIKLIENIEISKISLLKEVELGMIDKELFESEIEIMDKKSMTLKIKFVKENHKTEDGKERKITYHPATESNPKEYWITRIESGEGKKIKASSYDKLIEKLYDIYTENNTIYSVEKIFNKAIDKKIITLNPKNETIRKNRADYKKFINYEFSQLDVRNITENDIRKYICEYVNEHHPKEKSFLAMKGILNIIFNYAVDTDLIIVNPLLKIDNKPYLSSCDTSKALAVEKIHSESEIDLIKNEVYRRIGLKRFGGEAHYYIHGYALLISIETGMRVGELCSLKWEDIKDDTIHIHSQQLRDMDRPSEERYYLVNYTKGENGKPTAEGRQFPLTQRIKEILKEIKMKQEKLNIKSDFIFCNENGEWIKTEAYQRFLRRLCRSIGINITNNHAFRMSLNSNVFIPNGISVANRASLLGHTEKTNHDYYSFAQKDMLKTVCNILDKATSEGTQGNPAKIINFSA